jgi:hypothetical protein
MTIGNGMKYTALFNVMEGDLPDCPIGGQRFHSFITDESRTTVR